MIYVKSLAALVAGGLMFLAVRMLVLQPLFVASQSEKLATGAWSEDDAKALFGDGYVWAIRCNTIQAIAPPAEVDWPTLGVSHATAQACEEQHERRRGREVQQPASQPPTS